MFAIRCDPPATLLSRAMGQVPILAIAMLLWAAVAFAARTVEVSFSLVELGDAVACQSPAVLREFSTDSSKPPVSSWPVSLTNKAKIELDHHRATLLELVSDGCWAPRVSLPAGPEPMAATLQLWPTGTVEGELKLPQGVPVPTTVSVLARSVSGEDPQRVIPKDASFSCPIRDTQWSCRLPAGELDLKLQVGDLAAEFVWGVNVAPSQCLNIGVQRFERSGKLSGWAATLGQCETGQTLVVELVPESLSL